MHAPLVPVSDRTEYRPDIDGLRAVAVLSVLAYHYGVPLPVEWRLSGGFTGVDVFFVISGFLITRILAAEISAGTFSILGFYDRRIRRILPALLVMLAVTLLAGRFLLMPGDYSSLAASAAAAAVGVSNFYFLSNTGYFDQVSHLMPLLHTWSLAVEEQFYIGWPLLLFAIAAGRKRIDVAAVIIAVSIVGFGASLFWFDINPKSAFYMALPRAWEMALGAALVFVPPLPRLFGEAATALGLSLIAAGFVLVTTTQFPGPAALFPCVGAALVIWPRRTETLSGQALGFLAPIGLISYSLYLWHWPVWVFYRVYINGGQPRMREAIVLAAVSVGLAFLSWRFVERPFRKPRWQPAQSVWAGLGACMTIFCAAMYVNSADGLPQRLPPALKEISSFERMWNWDCPQLLQFDDLGDRFCVIGAPWENSKRRAVLWGDSKAAQLTAFLDKPARQADTSVLVFFTNCPANVEGKSIHRHAPQEPDYSQTCHRHQNQMIEFVRKQQVDHVILAAGWSFMFTQLYLKDPSEIGQKHGERLLEESLQEVISKISTPQISLLADTPVRMSSPLSCEIAKDALLLRRQCDSDKEMVPHRDFLTLQGPERDIITRIAVRNDRVKAYFPSDGLCDGQGCTAYVDGQMIYADRHHLRRNLPEQTNSILLERMGLTRLFEQPAL